MFFGANGRIKTFFGRVQLGSLGNYGPIMLKFRILIRAKFVLKFRYNRPSFLDEHLLMLHTE